MSTALNNTPPESIVEQKIAEALNSMIADVKERVIKEAITKFEEGIRKEVGKVTLQTLDIYSIQRIGPELVIRVMIEKL